MSYYASANGKRIEIKNAKTIDEAKMLVDGDIGRFDADVYIDDGDANKPICKRAWHSESYDDLNAEERMPYRFVDNRPIVFGDGKFYGPWEEVQQ